MSQEKDINEALVIPTTRDEFLAEWRSDPKAVVQKADESGFSLEGYGDVRAPATAESPAPTMEWLLYNEGIRMVDHLGVPSTLGSNMPDTDPNDGTKPDPLARAVIAYWDQVYNDALFAGVRATASVSPLAVNGGWNPTYDETPFRQPQIAPAFNFMNVVGYTRGIREKKYRLRKWTNDSAEQKMQEVAEGTEPKLFEITRATDEITMKNYRAGIEWTDEFMNDPQTRAMDITNSIEEIAIGHRIVLLAELGKLLHDSVPAGNVYTPTGTIGGVSHTAGNLEYPFWIDFLKSFGDAYIPNVTLGNRAAITTWELMSPTAGTNNITFGTWAMIPNSGINSLNTQAERMDYGWIGDANTSFDNTELFTFQRETTVVFVQQLGMNQDELQRVAGPRKTRRWLGAKSAFGIADSAGLRSLDF